MYFIIDVFPEDVGPSKRTGKSLLEMALSKSTVYFLNLSVSKNSHYSSVLHYKFPLFR